MIYERNDYSDTPVKEDIYITLGIRKYDMREN